MPLFVTPIDISGHAGPTAAYVAQQHKDVTTQLHSCAIGLKNQELFNVVLDVFKECSTFGWDGEGAEAIPHNVLRNTLFLVDALPLGLELPDISAEPDGAIELEWYRNPRRILSVSINPDGKLYYAALIGLSRQHGEVPFQEKLPEHLVQLIHKIGEVNA